MANCSNETRLGWPISWLFNDKMFALPRYLGLAVVFHAQDRVSDTGKGYDYCFLRSSDRQYDGDAMVAYNYWSCLQGLVHLFNTVASRSVLPFPGRRCYGAGTPVRE